MRRSLSYIALISLLYSQHYSPLRETRRTRPHRLIVLLMPIASSLQGLPTEWSERLRMYSEPLLGPPLAFVVRQFGKISSTKQCSTSQSHPVFLHCTKRSRTQPLDITSDLRHHACAHNMPLLPAAAAAARDCRSAPLIRSTT
ncbi:uncharacterized protein CLUP02_10693 [Colletotrichum lupini]|uniref:Uncharacterized protein n=1 Tax=Colletotrichum lupini TaxID=145971 RepID=A0A9Q8SYU1_9PEZI|nr:uncharacterized protein CLUP02_10693 [Colletotrichum lupini]UQC85196.1 hypothetical protein CLUP02_10693 [Colletotrichum lupini]